MLADPGAIAGLAARAEDAADLLRRERARLGTAASGIRWESTAAAAFAERARDGADVLRGGADRLDALADGLRRHARHVGDHLQLLVDLERRAAQVGRLVDSVTPW